MSGGSEQRTKSDLEWRDALATLPSDDLNEILSAMRTIERVNGVLRQRFGKEIGFRLINPQGAAA